jgi:phage terminase large subunit
MERVVPCVIDYAPRQQFVPFHARWQRFACIVTHRRAGKTVACIHDLHRAASGSQKLRPRYAYLSPFLRQSKAVAWDYLRAAIEPGRRYGRLAKPKKRALSAPSRS